MSNDNRVLVIVPAWNESASIGEVVGEITTALSEVDVLVVDDGSTDETAEKAKAAGALVARLPYNLGVGGAMRLGYRFARDNGYRVAVQVDADGQHDPQYIPKLVAQLDDADMVIGARFAGEGDYAAKGPRRWAMSLLALVLSRMAGTKLTDTTSGFRAVNKRLIDMFAGWYPVEYLGDTVETVVRVTRLKMQVKQVPVSMRVRMAGRPSQSPFKATAYLGRAMIILLLAFIRR